MKISREIERVKNRYNYSPETSQDRGFYEKCEKCMNFEIFSSSWIVRFHLLPRVNSLRLYYPNFVFGHLHIVKCRLIFVTFIIFFRKNANRYEKFRHLGWRTRASRNKCCYSSVLRSVDSWNCASQSLIFFINCIFITYLFVFQAEIILFKPSEGIQSEPQDFYFHPSVMKRDNFSQTVETFFNSDKRLELQTSTLNRRLKRSLQIADECSLKAKLPSRHRTSLDQMPLGYKEIKTEPIEAEDSGFCNSVPITISKSSLPTILLEKK